MIGTGLFLDRVLGGIPRGKIVEIFGDPSVGKSTLALQIVAAAQKQGLKCLWADVEYSFDTRYAESVGVDNATLGIIREETAEDTLDAIEKAIEDGEYGIVVLDSIGGLVPRAEKEKSSGEKVIGGQAGLIARFCRKIVPLIDRKQTTLIVINHSFVDIMSGRIMTSGGAKLAYHKSISIRLKQKPNVSLKQGDQKVGKVVIAEIKKDKVGGNEGVEVEGQLIFHQGFSRAHDQFAEELATGIITKKGNTYYRGEVKLGVGMVKAAEALKQYVMVK